MSCESYPSFSSLPTPFQVTIPPANFQLFDTNFRTPTLNSRVQTKAKKTRVLYSTPDSNQYMKASSPSHDPSSITTTTNKSHHLHLSLLFPSTTPQSTESHLPKPPHQKPTQHHQQPSTSPTRKIHVLSLPSQEYVMMQTKPNPSSLPQLPASRLHVSISTTICLCLMRAA